MSSNNHTSKTGDKQNSGLPKHMPDYLRLDSVGEVSSPIEKNKWTNQRSDINKSDRCYYNNFVDNFSMGTLIDSASSCWNSASSYLGNLCPHRTNSNNFVKSERNSRPSHITYIKNWFSKPSTNSFEKTAMDMSSCLNFDPVMSWSTSVPTLPYPAMQDHSHRQKPVHWTGKVFGFLGNCPVNQSNMKTTQKEPYVPPQKRSCSQRLARGLTTVDPNLKPYNARLLEKSKKLHEQRRDHVDSPYICPCQPKTVSVYAVQKTQEHIECKNDFCDNEKSGCEIVENSEKNTSHVREMTADKAENEILSEMVNPEVKDITSADVVHTQICQSPSTDSSCKTTDWFEYECEDFKCIPISEEKLLAAAQKCASDNIDITDSKESGADKPQLFCWSSVDNDGATQNTHLTNMYNESSQSYVDVHCKTDVPEVVEKVPEEEIKTTRINSDLTTTLQNEEKCEEKKTCSDNSLTSVLYVRNLDKKKHCSAKKRRRRKAQQNEACNTSNNKSNKTHKSSQSAGHNGTIAFILGYSSDESDINIHPFHMTCDINSDSDWTESGDDSDEICSSIEEENMLGTQLGFRCSDPLNGMNLSLQCMVQTSEPLTSCSNTCTSAIDDINISWQVHMAVDSEPKKKSKSKQKKEVSFATGKDLAAVHPIIAWSYAYQAARKGPWEEYARDRDRFLKRITENQDLLSPVLEKAHRDRIYRERFSDNNSADFECKVPCQEI